MAGVEMQSPQEELPEGASQQTPQEEAPELTPPTGGDEPIDPENPPVGFTQKPPQRRKTLVKDPEKTVKDIIKKYNDDLQDRADWTERRVQRTAKYRGWKEGKTFPWPGASDAHLPIIMTDVQRTEDTLHNAVLSVRPVMNAKAANKAVQEKEAVVDQLLDHQVFVENQGELKIGNLISAFVQDGQFVAYIPQIKEKQKTTRVHTVQFPPAGVSWDGWLMMHIKEYYPKHTVLPGKNAPWNWELKDTNPLTGELITKKLDVYQDQGEDSVQVICHTDETIFEGPSLIPKELEDIVVPARSENLQPQCMSNPTGAPHVFMVDYPSPDEILRLVENGFYDQVNAEDLAKIKATHSPTKVGTDPQSQKVLQDDLTGVVNNAVADASEDPFTRLTYFGRADLDGDGFEEEVVYWLLENPQVLLRARYLTEVYPMTPMRRPFAMAKYIPVNGQFYAIGLIELMESGYDIIKKTFDQMVDSGDITNTPWGFYRPMSGIRPEVIRMGPGDLYPTNNPKDDVFYPNMPQGMASFGHNLIAMVGQILDQATLVGQLQLGGVPQGKSAALRTTSNMQALLQQGDARPERVLRRFFTGLTEVWSQFHELNQIFLTPEKKFRISTGVTQNTDPYVDIPNKESISGRFLFEFGASILNTNRALATSALQEMIGVMVNPLLFQLGISTPDTVFSLLSDWVKARGQDPRKYVHSPTNTPGAFGPRISVEDVIMSVMNGYYPSGQPMEPLPEHIQKLQEFTTDPANLERFTEGQARLLAQYAATKVHEFQQQMEQQQMMQNAAQMQQSMGGGQGAPAGKQAAAQQGTPPNPGIGGNPHVNPRELLDESLPGAGGGQNG